MLLLRRRAVWEYDFAHARALHDIRRLVNQRYVVAYSGRSHCSTCSLNSGSEDPYFIGR